MTSVILVYLGGSHLHKMTSLGASIPYLIGTAAALCLFFGLWTPLAGVAIAIVQIWLFFGRSERPLVTIMLATLGAALAMIGPGVWSVDAQLYGRKHIKLSRDWTSSDHPEV